MDLKQHPLSAAFPAMSPEDFAALRADIKVNGQRDPITIFESMVLDGWHRYTACIAEGLTPRSELLGQADPVAFVKSRNLHRRHMTASQRALAVVECSKWAEVGRPNKNPAPGAAFSAAEPVVATSAQMAAEAEVAERTIRQAKVVAERAAPEVKEAVRSGAMSVKAGAETVREKPTKVESTLAAPRGVPASGPVTVTKPEPEEEVEHSTTDELLEELRAQVEQLGKELETAMADDKAAELVKWKRACDHARRQQSEAMESAARSQRREKWSMDQLRRIGRAVGVDDPAQLARTVEKLMIQFKESTA